MSREGFLEEEEDQKQRQLRWGQSMLRTHSQRGPEKWQAGRLESMCGSKGSSVSELRPQTLLPHGPWGVTMLRTGAGWEVASTGLVTPLWP